MDKAAAATSDGHERISKALCTDRFQSRNVHFHTWTRNLARRRISDVDGHGLKFHGAVLLGGVLSGAVLLNIVPFGVEAVSSDELLAGDFKISPWFLSLIELTCRLRSAFFVGMEVIERVFFFVTPLASASSGATQATTISHHGCATLSLKELTCRLRSAFGVGKGDTERLYMFSTPLSSAKALGVGLARRRPAQAPCLPRASVCEIPIRRSLAETLGDLAFDFFFLAIAKMGNEQRIGLDLERYVLAIIGGDVGGDMWMKALVWSTL
ncbi:hypothetical protein PG993_005501 [Apiospora rasikravindrae]|uniref:Uncharacterized protein n=1 Tax=Apiospora rasikravindrae TaxID=990691 RepID=A0ABR1TFV7_9PEZI